MRVTPSCIALYLLTCAATAAAEPTGPRRASFDRAPQQGESITFSRRQANVGDQTNQQLTVRMDLANTVRQGQEVVGKFVSKIKQEQQRVVTASHVDSQGMTAARVRYLQSVKTVATDDQSATPHPEPVSGKTYLCRREGKKLKITDEAGDIPPLAEFEIVSRGVNPGSE